MDLDSKTREAKSADNDTQSRLDGHQDRIQARLDELHGDFKELAADLREARQSGVRAQKDRIEGFKRALRDILQAADQANKEWH